MRSSRREKSTTRSDEPGGGVWHDWWRTTDAAWHRGTLIHVIQRRTVLILGAGASMPYGFPSGRDLRDKIIAGLRKDTAQLFQLLGAAGYDLQVIRNFRDALLKSGRPSVDVFLEHRSEFISVGKVAI